MNFNDYCTRMSLKEKLGWTDKMIKDLLTNIAYKPNGNFYGGGIVKLYKNTDIEKIETTEKYKELRDKINKRRTKEKEVKKIGEILEIERLKKEQEKIEFEKKQRKLAKFYEQDESSSVDYTNEEIKKVQWQKECLTEIENQNNVILTSPTSSGKTIVFLEWALKKKERPIFITAPIKSLSNQRYRELNKNGFIVGIETGDIKNVPINCEIICCTQEIYTNKYSQIKNSTLIIDEFHYIFEDSSRARTYIDSLKNTRAKNILICSATLGNLNELRNYINKVSSKKFYLYENQERLTKLIYKDSISKNFIKNSFVVTFSNNNCNKIALELVNIRKGIENFSEICKTKWNNNFKQIEKIANDYNINNGNLKDYMKYGISIYYGTLLPKEKIFIEKVFEKKLIDTIVGTDSLALGVNFPVQNVIFAQLVKYYENKPISKNLFQQISGRAGRKGFFCIGYVYYCNDFYVENNYYKLSNLYNKLLTQKNEDIEIELTPIISNILKNKVTIQEESEYIANNSTKNIDIKEISEYINREINYIKGYYVKKDKREEFKQNIANVYFDEYTPALNCFLFDCILQRKKLQDILEYDEFHTFNSLLQLRKYLLHLPKEYRNKTYISEIENTINNTDNTALSIIL